MRWIIPGDRDQLSDAIRRYRENFDGHIDRSPPPSRGPRVCLALFAAADALGLKFVRGVAPHLYLERLDSAVLEALGLIPAREGQRFDVFVRVPRFREAIFRAAVMRDGVPVSDVVQVWLDVADHPSRGPQQAEEIWRQVLARLWNNGAR